ncbi:MAG: methylmalonyl Co-A mutase-associated GTPase MeaB [Candidatus Kapabacteria bacterium]|nr:methylmalonyl Co-A mutase-associated GTPase MeaB [Candidatus Kapabacteria bacterium]
MDGTGSAQLIIAELRSGSRRALSKCLSLIESTRAEDRALAYEILEHCSSHTDGSWRIGCTGPPGVGKSTFIERIGMELLARGRRVAVLAVDPSSRRTGGSILGDKVRMPLLSTQSEAFVRPSPSKAMLGGAAPSTRDAIVICEAAGFDTIIIETVGVGQSETDVADLVDMFILLALANSGDDVQGIKRGIMEVADAVVITKSDVDESSVNRSAAILTGALRFMPQAEQDWSVPVMKCSSLTGQGADVVLQSIESFFGASRAERRVGRRRHQRGEWFDRALSAEIIARLTDVDAFRFECERMRHQCVSGLVAPSLAVHRLLGRVNITIKQESP